VTVLVTGANGFVGSHLVDELLRRGERVRCLARPTSDLRYLDTERVELIRGQLDDDDVLDRALDGVDVVHHYAALVRAPSESVFQRANVDLTLRVYERFALRAPSDARFVFCSSLAAAGPSADGTPLRESAPRRPITAYGRSKARAEEELIARPGPELTILRPVGVYGPREKAILRAFRIAARGWFLVAGDPERPLSLVHVHDLVSGAAEASRHPKAAGGTFFMNGPSIPTWREVGDALEEALGRRLRRLRISEALVHALAGVLEIGSRIGGSSPLFDREKAKDLVAKGWTCSNDAAGEAFGYAPTVDVVGGFHDTVRWYREEGWL
jgi:nucleoside-diphosphate-sugar epimerase